MGEGIPICIRSWENNWDVISPFYKFPEEIRKIIYTTNIIEGLHRQFRKVTKTKQCFQMTVHWKDALFRVNECGKEMDTKV